MVYSDYYQSVALVISYINEAVANRKMPSLSQLAEKANLTEDTLQRAFSVLVGISPKRYWQLRLAQLSQQEIGQSQSNMDLTYNLGLSSTSRLNDLFINVVAMTPTEFRAHGQDMTLYYGVGITPFGEAEILWGERGITALRFKGLEESIITYWRLQFNQAVFKENNKKAEALLARVFGEWRSHEPLYLWVKGTNFQINVWQALIGIPSGITSNYQSIARHIGNEKAVRAVGTAIGANPIAYIIPCHRVIRSDGGLGGYRWGIERKQIMLANEVANKAG